MDCKEKDYRSFTHHNESYYAKVVSLANDVQDEVFFGLSCGGGGTHGEMKVQWPLETTAKIGSVSGINDGRSRAILAEVAVTTARKALGIEVLS